MSGNHEHGRHNTPERRAWRSMHARCLNPRHQAYASYGGRGITICQRWQDSFEAFLVDLGERPSPEHSLDRIDNDRGYEPGNCRWATRTEQARNTRGNAMVVFRGRTMCLAEAIELSGLCRATVAQRLFKGWPLERALTTPAQPNRHSVESRMVTYRGRRMRFGKAAELAGLTMRIVTNRLAKGWSIRQVLDTPLGGRKSTEKAGQKAAQ